MEILKNKNTIIGIVLIVVLGFAAYWYLSKDQTASTDLVSSGTQTGVGADVLTSLVQLNAIKLDTTVFDTINSFGLQDYSQGLPTDATPGRPNPFEPILFGRSESSGGIPGGTQTFVTGTSTSSTSTKAR